MITLSPLAGVNGYMELIHGRLRIRIYSSGTSGAFELEDGVAEYLEEE